MVAVGDNEDKDGYQTYSGPSGTSYDREGNIHIQIKFRGNMVCVFIDSCMEVSGVV